MRYVLHKDSSCLTESDRWYLTRFLHLLEELRVAYELKESYKKWQNDSKNEVGINNTSKVVKRNAYGFKKYEHFKAKVLLSRKYKNVGIHLG